MWSTERCTGVHWAMSLLHSDTFNHYKRREYSETMLPKRSQSNLLQCNNMQTSLLKYVLCEESSYHFTKIETWILYTCYDLITESVTVAVTLHTSPFSPHPNMMLSGKSGLCVATLHDLIVQANKHGWKHTFWVGFDKFYKSITKEMVFFLFRVENIILVSNLWYDLFSQKEWFFLEKLMLGMKFFKHKDKLFETVVKLPHHYMWTWTNTTEQDGITRPNCKLC